MDGEDTAMDGEGTAMDGGDTAMDGEDTAMDGEDTAGDQAEGSIRSAPGGAAESLAELVAGHLRATSPAIETVCYGGGPARLPLLIGVE
jgi:hypothetical protein